MDNSLQDARGDEHPRHHHHNHSAGHVHTHGTVSDAHPGTRYNWQIHHPFDGVHDRVAVEVSPWSGLLPRWRFVIPADYEGLVRWGVGGPGGCGVDFNAVRRPVTLDDVHLKDGPVVKCIGGHNPLSSSLSAFVVFEGAPPHYLAFGQAEEPDGPPGALEGIYFNAHEHHASHV